MSVMRFTGANSREAMRRVRENLGEDALILANRQTDNGVVILAMADQAAEAMADAVSSPPASQRPAVAPPVMSTLAVSGGPDGSWQATSAELLREMQDMRALLAREKAQRSPGGACRAHLEALLTASGFSRALSDELLAALPEELLGAPADDARPLAWLQRQLVARLTVADDGLDPLARGGIVALVGPTGVGKTTTTAKLAARYVMRHGPERVVLVTTDGFRIGAHEQLRIYAELLGIPMHALDSEQPLEPLLGRLQHKRFVIIDTVGMSQRDQRIIEQVARLRSADRPLQLMLLLNAASQPEALEEVITNFRQAARAAGAELDDCLLTKEDEAGRLGPLLDGVLRHGLRLRLVAHGQRVPEDLSPADPQALVRQALEAGRRALLTASPPTGVSGDWSRSVLGQGRRLATLLAGLRERVEDFAALEAVWDLAALPSVLQGQRLDGLLDEASRRASAAGLWWSPRERVRGCDWSMPDLSIDAAGGWQAMARLQHRQPAGQVNRLADAVETLGAGAHLFPALPDAEALRFLEAHDQAWVARARPTQRLWHGRERLTLSRLAGLAAGVGQGGESECRFRQRTVQLALSSLTVALATPGQPGSPGMAARAWFGELRDPDTGRALGRRYWLAPERLGDEAIPLLLGQLEGEALPRLTRRAWQRLCESHPEASAEVRLMMAAGLAAVAARVDRSEGDWAMDLRAELLGLLGGRRRRSSEALLEALLYAVSARDAIRHLGAAGLEGLRQ